MANEPLISAEDAQPLQPDLPPGLPQVLMRTVAQGGFTPWNYLKSAIQTERDTNQKARDQATQGMSPDEARAYDYAQAAASSGMPTAASWVKVSSPRVRQLLGEEVKPWLQNKDEFVKSVWDKLGRTVGQEIRPEWSKLVGARSADIARTESFPAVAESIRNELTPNTPIRIRHGQELPTAFPFDKFNVKYDEPGAFRKNGQIWLEMSKNKPNSLEDLGALRSQMLNQVESSQGFNPLSHMIPQNKPQLPENEERMKRLLQSYVYFQDKNPAARAIPWTGLSNELASKMMQTSDSPQARKILFDAWMKAINENPSLALRMENVGGSKLYDDFWSEYVQRSLAEDAMKKGLEIHPELLQDIRKYKK